MFIFQLKRATQITLLTVAVLGGILWGQAGHDISWQVVACLAGATMALAIFKSRLAFPVMLAAVLAFGVWRGHATIFENTELGHLVGKNVTLRGVITDDPALNDRNFLVFKMSDLQYDGHPLSGSVQVQTSFKKLQRGYRVEVSGKPKPNLGITRARMAYGQVSVISDHVSFLEAVRQRFIAGLRSTMPDSLAGFGLGLLVGTRALIPKDLQDVLVAVGLTHLVAVSGYNLTIIIRAANRLFGRISTFVSTAASLWLIAGFLLVAGFSASIVRAAIVSVLSLLTIYYGHKIKPIVLVALPAALTAAYNPDYLTRDLGWQLSFLAFIGIVVLAPLVEQRFIRRPNILLSLLVESSMAQLMTFPLILLVFSQASVVSPLSNLIILPLVPFAMLLVFLTGIVSMIAPVLGNWVALPAIGFLGIVVGIIQSLAQLHFASIQINASPTQIAIIFGLILIFIASVYRASKRSPNGARKERLLA